MAKRRQAVQQSYDPVSQKFLAELSRPVSPSAPIRQPESTETPELPRQKAPPRNREKRVLLTASEDQAIERQIQQLASELQTPLKLSHTLRACLELLRRAEPQILAHARQRSPLRRPPNGDVAALAHFEQQLAELVRAALQDLPPLSTNR